MEKNQLLHSLGLTLLLWTIFFQSVCVVGEKDDNNNPTDYREKRNSNDDVFFYQGAEGTPGIDFPTLSHVPKTKFSCKEMEAGYYADLDTDCQVFHICDEGRKLSFLCPNGTIFQQKELICDWWFKVNCTTSPLLYEESAEVLHKENVKRKEQRRIYQGTKHGIFSNKEDQNYKSTPAHLVTPSYPHRSSTSSFQSTEATFAPKHNERVDRKLSSIGNGVQESNTKRYNPFTQKPSNTYEKHHYRKSQKENELPNDNSNIQFKNNDEAKSATPLFTERPKTTQNYLNNHQRRIYYESTTNKLNSDSSETQIPQETASFVKNTKNILQDTTKVYPNHRSTYSEIKDPRQYYEKSQNTLPEKPFYGSSINPQVLSTVPVTLKSGVTTAKSVERTSISTATPKKDINRIDLSLNSVSSTLIPEVSARNKEQSLFQTESPIIRVTVVNPSPITNSRTGKAFNDTLKGSTNNIKNDSPIIRVSSTISNGALPSFSISNFGSPTTPSQNNYQPTLNISDSINDLYDPSGKAVGVEINTNKVSIPIKNDFRNVATTETAPIIYSTLPNIQQPKPFSKASDNEILTDSFTGRFPPYTLSSASPFAVTFPVKTPEPTLATPFTTSSDEENLDNMINTLMEVLKKGLKINIDNKGIATPRPGLVVPPSAGPQTLHSLAIYFANALDNLTATAREESSEESYEVTDKNFANDDFIRSLLTQMTLVNYASLFKEQYLTTTEVSLAERGQFNDSEDDLSKSDTTYPTEAPGVRQLARVFTEALSAYLEDPDTFKKVLHDVRPTEPPISNDLTTENEEDEVLNYSDSDLTSDLSHHPTASSINPTWSYILAVNKNISSSGDLTIRNAISEHENLQSADSQSFISQINKIVTEYSNTKPPPTESYKETLPENHWTTSSDVAKLWQTTLLINPATLNDNFDVTPLEAEYTSKDVASSEETTTPPLVTSEIKYELRTLPQIDLNSTQVHGILIDFIKENKTEGSEKLQRILHKLNITQEEFLNKMKEIEGNPLTRRLILLLINECNSDESKLNKSAKETVTEPNIFKQLADPKLQKDEDERALELLNSLYVIASKFGK